MGRHIQNRSFCVHCQVLAIASLHCQLRQLAPQNSLRFVFLGIVCLCLPACIFEKNRTWHSGSAITSILVSDREDICQHIVYDRAGIRAAVILFFLPKKEIIWPRQHDSESDPKYPPPHLIHRHNGHLYDDVLLSFFLWAMLFRLLFRLSKREERRPLTRFVTLIFWGLHAWLLHPSCYSSLARLFFNDSVSDHQEGASQEEASPLLVETISLSLVLYKSGTVFGFMTPMTVRLPSRAGTHGRT